MMEILVFYPRRVGEREGRKHEISGGSNSSMSGEAETRSAPQSRRRRKKTRQLIGEKWMEKLHLHRLTLQPTNTSPFFLPLLPPGSRLPSYVASITLFYPPILFMLPPISLPSWNPAPPRSRPTNRFLYSHKFLKRDAQLPNCHQDKILYRLTVLKRFSGGIKIMEC